MQVVVAPGAMLAGEQATEVRLDVSDANVIDAVCELPFNVAVTAATWPVAPLPAPAEKVPLVAPAVMEIVAGTVIVVVLLDRATLTPPQRDSLRKCHHTIGRKCRSDRGRRAGKPANQCR